MTRYLIFLLAVLLASTSTFAQSDDTPAPAATEEDSLLEEEMWDWLFSGESAEEDLGPPAGTPPEQIISVPAGAVSLYRGESLEQLLLAFGSTPVLFSDSMGGAIEWLAKVDLGNLSYDVYLYTRTDTLVAATFSAWGTTMDEWFRGAMQYLPAEGLVHTQYGVPDSSGVVERWETSAGEYSIARWRDPGDPADYSNYRYIFK